MINKFRQAFSLAELLIVIAIIAIVIAMSFTIAKKGIKNAYNLFFYTGYNGIYEAIGDAIDYGYALSSTNISNCDFINHIVKILSAEKTTSGNGVQIAAPNGIVYNMSFLTNYTEEMGDEEVTKSIYKIVMKIPYQKTGNINEAKITLYYLPDYNNGILVPSGVINADNNVNLQNRQDLLPFYIDDGSVGRAVETSSGSYSYTKPTYTNFKTAFCQSNGSLVLGGNTYVNCTGITTNSKKGLLKAVNPRKIF